MSNIIEFGGMTTLDLPPDKVLTSAVGELNGCLVIGYDQKGGFYFASSYGDDRQILWMIEQAKKQLLETEIL